ncbi:hypothetical protein ACN28E_01175 [Archangium lansingense]|uniref:hypothetical protein n=1 Tax=Archangium lansingense TaxID=2995310 RepID=UPI003B779F8D
MARGPSHHQLIAEVEACPFASDVALAQRTTRLVRTTTGVLDGPTEELAKALESSLRLRAVGASLEVLSQLRDGVWFRGGEFDVPLARVLTRLAREHLLYQGGRIGLRHSNDMPLAEAASRVRWLSFRLPMDLTIAAMAADAGFEPSTDRVTLVTPTLARVLDQPAAETHLHVGAAVPFEMLWSGLIRGLAGDTPEERKLERGGPPPFGSAQRFLRMLLIAAITRTLLGRFVWRVERIGFVPFAEFLEEELREDLGRVEWPWGTRDLLRLHYRVLDELHGVAPSATTLPRLRGLYRHLIGPVPTRRPTSLAEVLERDPLAGWLQPSPGLAVPETRFASRAIRLLLGRGASDELLAATFWQYERIRCITYRYLVEEPGTAGLDWFTRHYNRIGALREMVDELTFESALVVESADLHLGALEARTAPDDRWYKVLHYVRGVARQAARFEPLPGRDRPEVGLVLHFIKSREWTHRGAKRLQADPRHLAFGCRYGPWFHEQRQRALAVERALRHSPELLLVLRALDVANLELSIPTWPLVPLFQRLRTVSAELSGQLARLRPGWQVPPLRTTIHAGEDFRRLVEGLRRIHETIEFGLVSYGDRIGHGIALGLAPSTWASSSRVVMQPAEERLDDLLWELARYQRGDLPADVGRVEFVRAEARRLSRDIYGPAVIDAGWQVLDVDEQIEARRLRHDPALLDRFGYPFVVSIPPSNPIARHVWLHLTHPDVFERGQRPVEILAQEHELRMLEAAQRWLRAELGRLEITVESNPSSNLLIGALPIVEEHPVFRLQHLRGRSQENEPPVQVSVNVDNPLTFASRLADEFAHLYYALLRKDVAASDALAWINEAREHGWHSRFTLPASAEREALEVLFERSGGSR